ncbi:BRCA2 repeat-containing protein [Dictyostelium discoideum AX4]|uniref:BRCA2 repeat-containing protein n=1 Tax=Dictyostelium discoideum TaxID=44689 RepID=Q54RN2_DICDI|nr:BRCA2 repeat-containing protein [Dictyostelium discoideum AX4]EAL65953.1 BRCA2 repeat-containing protein [Dictyostelium discoideum AX4]|eukprot:XP_639319.1 BRCA2 repeat-containing protein [Dictyostelium discoideum AX4]
MSESHNQNTNFTSGKGEPITVTEESIEKAKGIISSVEKTPPTKRGRNDNENIDTEPIQSNYNNNNNNFKVNKFDNKESTGFKTASNLPIRVSKETLNNEKSKIDIEHQQDIDINNYNQVLSTLEQPFKVDRENTQ